MKKPEVEIFDTARKEYPGNKRGCETEFKRLKKHKDWRNVIPLLLPAIEQQKQRRKIKKSKNEFVPSWKHFETWLNKRCWEETEGVEEPQEEAMNREHLYIEQRKRQIREDYEDYLRGKSTTALKDIQKDGGQLLGLCGWLIDEILRNRQAKEVLK